MGADWLQSRKGMISTQIYSSSTINFLKYGVLQCLGHGTEDVHQPAMVRWPFTSCLHFMTCTLCSLYRAITLLLWPVTVKIGSAVVSLPSYPQNYAIVDNWEFLDKGMLVCTCCLPSFRNLIVFIWFCYMFCYSKVSFPRRKSGWAQTDVRKSRSPVKNLDWMSLWDKTNNLSTPHEYPYVYKVSYAF